MTDDAQPSLLDNPKAKARAIPWTAEQVIAALAARYPTNAWAFLTQVRNGTGWAREPRTADALALGLWPSRGLELHGFEVKVSRGDWLAELKAPEKADAIARFCHRWWLVVGHAEIVQPGELPAAWGLLVPAGDKLRCAVEATKLDPKPLDALIVAAMLRRASDAMTPNTMVAAKIEAAVADKQSRLDAIIADEKAQRAQTRREIEAFQQASGVRINEWDAGNIGAAVRYVIERGPERVRKDMERLKASALAIVKAIDAELNESG